jgi:cytidylate kinase
MVVAIDGPAGVGKSTITRRVAHSTGFQHLSSGKLYRAVTWKVLRSKVDPADDCEVVRTANSASIDIRDGAVLVDGVDAGSGLHTDDVDYWVSRHSAISRVRTVVNRRLTEIARGRDVVVEGRDMSTVVFPDAEVKIYLDASLDERARRRYAQNQTTLSYEELKKAIADRDAKDRAKAEGALRVAEDAVYLDTSDLTIEQVCEKVIDTIKRHVDSRSY